MSEESQGAPVERPAGQEVYAMADQAQVALVGGRRAAKWVPFLLPHLRPGMRLLDVGCGVGSITLDLAELVAPGETVGMDMDERQLEIARVNAASRGLVNARFQAGSAYELPFADAAFDVALAHTLLFHLSDQARALRELRRVLAPGGLVAVSDDHWGTWLIAPDDAPMRRALDTFLIKALGAGGAAPFYSPHLRGLLRAAGFARTQGIALAPEHYGTLEETRHLARILDLQLSNQAFVAQIVAQGWATADEIVALRQEMLAWGERPDAFAAVMYCAALGWVDADTKTPSA